MIPSIFQNANSNNIRKLQKKGKISKKYTSSTYFTLNSSLLLLFLFAIIEFLIIIHIYHIQRVNMDTMDTMNMNINTNTNTNTGTSTRILNNSTINYNYHNNSNDIFDIQLEGVAIHLMLHSPNWFIKRYTHMIHNILNNIPSNWKIQIFYTGKGQSQAGLDLNPGLRRLVSRNQIILTPLPEELSKIKRYELMVHPWLWENVAAEKVVTFGGNQVFCSNSRLRLRDFLHFDFIGPPCHWNKGVGGDGSISIRSRSHMLKALQYAYDKITDEKKRKEAYKTQGQEDMFFVNTLQEMIQENKIKSKIATKEETYQFGAIGSYGNQTVLVAAGILPDMEYDARDSFLTYCPELKMVFPNLHDPNCFGAHPNAEGCRKSICALQIPKRKGGCA